MSAPGKAAPDHPWIGKRSQQFAGRTLKLLLDPAAETRIVSLVARSGRADGDYHDFSNTSFAHGFLSSSLTTWRGYGRTRSARLQP
jgi:hypothetical protein